MPRTRRWGAWGIIAVLIGIFPANVHMALNPELYAVIPPAALWARLPLQAVLIAWAYRYVGADAVRRAQDAAR